MSITIDQTPPSQAEPKNSELILEQIAPQRQEHYGIGPVYSEVGMGVLMYRQDSLRIPSRSKNMEHK